MAPWFASKRSVDVFLEGAQKPLIVIVGPTASGKTALSIEIAKHVGGEIVNADSRQLYTYLDIGTAKITEREKEGIPHHLLDIKDPKEEVTVGKYQAEALRAIEDILAREKIPILVGGSMLYVSSVVDHLLLPPAADPYVRRRLEEAYDADGGEVLCRRLQTIDPDSASLIHPNNKPSLVRALEIYEMLKAPKSEVIEQKKCSYDLLMLGIRPPREELLRRITERTEQMFEAGWIEEVRDLLARGYGAEDHGMRSHGYREICEFLKEIEGSDGSEEIEAMKERLKQRIITKTRQYAKRQLTWWRHDPRIRWVHPGIE